MPTVKIARPTGAAKPARPLPAAAVARGSQCRLCGASAPLRHVELNQNIGLIVFRLQKTVCGDLCAPCIRSTYARFTLVTLFGGWWGLMSCIMAPGIIFSNTLYFLNVLAGRGKLARAAHMMAVVFFYFGLLFTLVALTPDSKHRAPGASVATQARR
jgi:hypothetical protein